MKHRSTIDKEKHIVELMIRLYCRRKEGHDNHCRCKDDHDNLCPECQALLDYALLRLSRCPFGENKTSCRRCPVHCYSPLMRERIRIVMRYSGPRMLLYHPIETLKHL